jgi:hypothetical protein
MSLRRPRQWGAWWLGCELWQQLGLDTFWRERLPVSREGTRWDQVLLTLTLYRLIDPGAEWRLHQHWFDHTAIEDLLGGDFSLAEPSGARWPAAGCPEGVSAVRRHEANPPTLCLP